MQRQFEFESDSQLNKTSMLLCARLRVTIECTCYDRHGETSRASIERIENLTDGSREVEWISLPAHERIMIQSIADSRALEAADSAYEEHLRWIQDAGDDGNDGKR